VIRLVGYLYCDRCKQPYSEHVSTDVEKGMRVLIGQLRTRARTQARWRRLGALLGASGFGDYCQHCANIIKLSRTKAGQS